MNDDFAVDEFGFHIVVHSLVKGLPVLVFIV